jgi:hypothetical protein
MISISNSNPEENMNMDYQRELLSFDEKIALAKLEESKASERVKVLEYEKARFNLEFFLVAMKQQQEAATTKSVVSPGQPQTTETK